jgi:hypothetical protein
MTLASRTVLPWALCALECGVNMQTWVLMTGCCLTTFSLQVSKQADFCYTFESFPRSLPNVSVMCRAADTATGHLLHHADSAAVGGAADDSP